MNYDSTTDVNFNLSQYMIDQTSDSRQRQWQTSRSCTDAGPLNRNWRRADLVDNRPARDHNTWELTHRSPGFPVRTFPARLVTGYASNGEELAPVDSSDEDVWIPRRLSNQRRHDETNARCQVWPGSEMKLSSCGDVLRTRTNPSARLCSTRS